MESIERSLEQTSMSPARIKVLIVDDLSTVRKVMRKLLTEIGFTCFEEATDGQQALEKIRAGSFDIVFSDWNMPKLQGLELLKILRADEAYKFLPFIMVTANRSREHVAEAVKCGANDYMCKPFDVNTLRLKIEGVLKRKLNHSA